MPNEQAIINKLRNFFNFPDGISDDAAVIRGDILDKNQSYVITKDLLVEDVHFRKQYYSSGDLAYKALHVNLSDIAAMGAISKFVLLGIAIPTPITDDYINLFLEEFSQNCRNANVVLIGGDTVASIEKLFISVTVVGSALNNNLKFRKGAKLGDIVCVAGNLGLAHIGLMLLENSTVNVNVSPPLINQFKSYSLRPRALVREGLWFGGRMDITAMMDISDGLYLDLNKLCIESNVYAQITVQNYYHVENRAGELDAFLSICKNLNIDPLKCQLTGGEDYGLLVTISPENFARTASDFENEFNYKLTQVGCIIDYNNDVYSAQRQHRRIAQSMDRVKIIANGKDAALTLKCFSHFGEGYIPL